MTGKAQYRIERLGHRGDGIAPGPLFAPLTLPGEVITADIEGDRLYDIRIVEPSSDRVSPPCRHFRSCGGCQLQHASDAFVADWKLDVVARALAAQDIETELRPIITCPPRSRRRASFSARRTKKGATAGFHARGSDAIVEIPDCQLISDDLRPALDAAKALAAIAGSRRGELTVTTTTTPHGLDIAVSGGPDIEGPQLLDLAREAERLALARLSWNAEVIAARHPAVQRFGAAEVVPPPGAFLQATPSGQAALLAAVRESLAGCQQICDLFAGCGTFALPLAEAAELYAVEGSAEMVAALDQGWRRAQGLKRVTTEARDLFRRPLDREELARFDGCVIDPPRAGAEAQIAELARSNIARIAHVSCNPVTFARDAKTLIGAGFRLAWVQVVDQFRWSSHVELVGDFRRDG